MKKRGLNLTVTLTLIRGVRKCNSDKTMFTSRVMVIKMENIALFVLSADDSKQLVIAWAKHLSATEKSS